LVVFWLAKDVVELFLVEPMPELRRSFLTTVVGSAFATTDMVALSMFLGAIMLPCCDVE
jgi:hypothetical protein